MKNLLTAFLNSLYNPEWLKKQRFAWGKAWSYFALFVFVFSVLVTIPTGLRLWPEINNGLKSFTSQVPDFDASVKDGLLTIGKLKQPYIYRFENDEFVFVVDTVRTTTAAVSEYVTSSPRGTLLITSDRIEFSDNEKGTTRVQRWSNASEGKVTKTEISNVIKTFLQPWFYFLGMVALFLGFFIGFFISKLYAIAIVTLVASVVARAANRTVKTREIFTMSLYAITLPTMISVVFTLIGVTVAYVQFIALLAFMIAVIFTMPRTEIKEEN